MYSTFNFSKSKCLTCNNQVLKTLGSLQGVFGVEMESIDGSIVVSHTEEVTREEIVKTLVLLGFSEVVAPVNVDEPSEWGCAL